MVVSLPVTICRKLLTYIIPLKTQACYYFVVKQSKWYWDLQPQGRKNVSRIELNYKIYPIKLTGVTNSFK